MVEAKAVHDAGAAIVSGHEEALMPEVPHGLDLVLRHRPEGIINVPLAAIGLAGIAIAAQIGDHDTVLAREFGGDFVPTYVGRRVTVQ